MKLKYRFENVVMDNQILAVPIGENADHYQSVVVLNDSAAEVFEMLKEDTSESAIVSALMQKYANSEPELAAAVHRYICQLKEQGLLI